MIFSYTLIDTFHNVCPRQAYERWWLKVKEPETQAMIDGKWAHKCLAQRLMYRESLPFGVKDLEPTCAAIEARGTAQCEVKMAVDRNLQSSGFFDNDTYIRGVL